ncbi:MAG: hypothetical protein RRY34_08280 [Victivallaceae bacterium]
MAEFDKDEQTIHKNIVKNFNFLEYFDKSGDYEYFKWYYSGAGRAKLFGIYVTRDLPPEVFNFRRFTKWNENMVQFGDNVYEKLFFAAFFSGILLLAFFLIGNCCCKQGIHSRHTVGLLLVLWVAVLLGCMPVNWSIFMRPDWPEQFTKLQLVEQEGKLSELLAGKTQIIPKYAPDNPLPGELLIGGKDVFTENFLSWQFNDNQYLYYFAQSHKSDNIIGKNGRSMDDEHKIYTVSYEDDIAFEKFYLFFYFALNIGILAIIIYWRHVYGKILRTKTYSS